MSWGHLTEVLVTIDDMSSRFLWKHEQKISSKLYYSKFTVLQNKTVNQKLFPTFTDRWRRTNRFLYGRSTLSHISGDTTTKETFLPFFTKQQINISRGLRRIVNNFQSVIQDQVRYLCARGYTLFDWSFKRALFSENKAINFKYTSVTFAQHFLSWWLWRIFFEKTLKVRGKRREGMHVPSVCVCAKRKYQSERLFCQ